MGLLRLFYSIFLWWSVIGFSIWVGGTIFSMFVVVPMWSASPPESVRFFFGKTTFMKHIRNFFGPVWMAARSLPIFITLVLGWNLRPERDFLMIAAASMLFGIIFTLAYVYPINKELMIKAGGDHKASEIRSMVSKWIFADRLRFFIMLIGYIFLLVTFHR